MKPRHAPLIHHLCTDTEVRLPLLWSVWEVRLQVVHCQIMPEHVLLFDYPQFCAKLTGIGKSAMLARPYEDSLRASDVHSYSAPEAVLQHQCNAASDIWALGAAGTPRVHAHHRPSLPLDHLLFLQAVCSGNCSLASHLSPLELVLMMSSATCAMLLACAQRALTTWSLPSCGMVNSFQALPSAAAPLMSASKTSYFPA